MVMIGDGNDEEDNDRRRDGFKGHHRRILTATTEGEGENTRVRWIENGWRRRTSGREKRNRGQTRLCRHRRSK